MNAPARKLLLRLEDERPKNKILVLNSFLSAYASKIAGHFIVITENKVRFARPR
jgi:hypothetical protein